MSERTDGLDGERTVSPTAGGRRGMSNWQKAALFGVGTAAIISAVFWRDSVHHATEGQPAPPVTMGQAAPFERFAPPKAEPAAFVPPPRSLSETLHEAAQQPAPVIGNQQARKRMLSFASATPTAPKTEAMGGTAQPEGKTSVAFKAGQIPGGKAGPAMDLTYMLMPGVVKCVLDNAIDTTQPGPIFCETSEDVFSPVHVKLMEAHTKIVGSYTSGMQQGQSRLPAVSAYAITPKGVPIALTSPMGDALGRSGITGEIDTHFKEKFGGALLLLASQGVVGAAQAALQRGNGNAYLNLQTGGVESAISEVLRNTINIPPTVRVNQGTEIAFLVTVPIDFHDAYVLRTAP